MNTPRNRRWIGLLALLAVALPATVAGQADTAAAVHLLRRATWGVRPADVAEVLRVGQEAWLDRQLVPEPDPDLAARLSGLAWLEAPMATLPERFPPPDVLGRELAERYGIDAEALMDPERRRELPPEVLRELRERSPRRLLEDLATARLIRAVHAQNQLEDVLTDFWFNHFNVWAGKQLTRFMIPDYERTAIRPHVFGRFEDMLVATARHPAMLFYLDNWTSIAADSLRPDPGMDARRLRRLAGLSDEQKERLVRSGRITREQLRRLEEAGPIMAQAAQRMRGRGLNENYARELLELHTVGVDGGYTQADVVDVARTMTGWTFVPFGLRGPQGPRPGGAGAEPGTFVFNVRGHDTGVKTVLGERFDDGGQDEGVAMLRMLARRPETARFVSTKLVERFVSDTPDPALVDALTEVWIRTGGDLRTVTRALFTSDAFRDPAGYGSKVKTPFELVASTYRATGADARPSRRTMETLRTMGQMPYDASAPTGYPARAEEWVNSGAMLARMNFALAFAGGRIDNVRPDVRSLIADSGRALHDVIAGVLPGTDTRALQSAIEADLAANAADATARIRVSRALGLALGSPEFQAR